MFHIALAYVSYTLECIDRCSRRRGYAEGEVMGKAKNERMKTITDIQGSRYSILNIVVCYLVIEYLLYL